MLSNLKIGAKIIGGFVVVAIIMGVVGWMTISNLRFLDDRDTMLYQERAVPIGFIGDISTNFQRIRVNTRDLLLATDEREKSDYRSRIDQYRAENTETANSLDKISLPESGKRDWEAVKSARTDYNRDLDEFINLIRSNKDKEALALLRGDAARTSNAYMTAVDKLHATLTEEGKKLSDENTAVANGVISTMTIIILAGAVLGLVIGFLLSRMISAPLSKMAQAAGQIAIGDVNQNIELRSGDELGVLANSFRSMIDYLKGVAVAADGLSKGDLKVAVTPKSEKDLLSKNFQQAISAIRNMSEEAERLSKAAVEGRLQTRADASKYQGAYADIVQGVNRTLDAVIGPLTVAANYVDRISKGDIPAKITDSYNGDFNEIKNNLNMCVDAVNALVADANVLSKAAVDGRLATRADATKHQGEFRKIVQGVNDTLDAVIGPLNVAAGYVDRISKGDIPPKITDKYNGDFNEIKNNLNTCVDAVNALVGDAAMLSKAAVDGRLATRADAAKHQGDFRKIVQGVNETLDAVIGPLNVAAGYVDRISKGDIPPKITDKYNGDFNEIKNNLNVCIDSLNGLVAEMNQMSNQHDLGDIDVKVDVGKFTGAYKVMAEGVNAMVFGHIAVKKKAMACVSEFGRGNFEAPLEKFPGKKVFINETIEQVRSNLKALIADANLLSKAAVEGRLATRADATKHQGDFRKIVQGVNETLDAVIGPLNVAAKYVDRISKGDIPPKITDNYNGDFNEIKNNLNVCVDAVNALVADAGLLAKAAVEGRLATRADASKHQGDFRKIVQGVNETLDAVIGPLNVAAKYVDRISKGDIPPKITDSYNGDFNEIKNNLNTCVDAVNALVADADLLAKAAVEGRLATRADASKHQGDFRKIVQGVNETLDAVIGPLKVAAGYVDRISKGDIPPKITDKYNGDFNEIKNNLNVCVDAVNALVADAAMLSTAAVDGRLATRADASRHQGDFRKIVQGVNDTLDAVIGPLKVAAGYVDRISKGDIPPKITDKYNGDFNEIKNNLNVCVDAVNTLVGDSDMLVQAAVEGRLDTRADATKHQGDFRKIVQGVNQTLDAVLGPINEAADVLVKVAAKDLTARVLGSYAGDLAKIKNSLNTAVQNLDEGLQQVAVGSEQVSSAAGEISAGSQSLAQGSSEQASSLEEVSSSLQEMASMSKQNTSNAQQARGLAEQARRNSDRGVDSMKKLKGAIDQIKSSSDRTAKIVKTIDEIAFQTNLLALNAAVEAARAGEAGKGFAVVAEEVRNLAMRSAEAAKNTANLIEESVKNSENGVIMNQEVLNNLEEINQQINKVSEVVTEIAAASEQQSQGVDQINKAVEQMNQVVQQVAANSEESASASEELLGQAEEMKSMVGSFRLSAHSGSGSSPRGRSLPPVPAAPRRAAAAPAAARPAPRRLAAPSAIPLNDEEDKATMESF